MANYTLRADGTAANLAAALDGDPTVASECLSLAGYASYGAGASPGDHFQFADDGGAFRTLFTALESGTDGNRFVFEAYSGDTPILSGADRIETWTLEGSDHYSADLTTDPPQVFMDDVRLTEGSAKDALNDHEWFWEANKLYVRDDSGDPDVTAVVIEASVRALCFRIPSMNYITVDGLVFEKAKEDNVEIDDTSSNITVQNCESHRALWRGISKNLAGASTGVVIDSNVVTYNGGCGIHARNGSDGWSIKKNHVHHNSQLHYRDGYTAGIKVNYSDNHIIEQNYVHDENDCGIWADITCSGIVVKHNLVHGSVKGGTGEAQGIRFEKGTSDSFILYNICYDNAHAGIALTGNGASGADDGVHRNLIYGNVCFDNGSNFGISVDGINGVADSCTDNIIKNNISIEHGRNLRAQHGGENDGTMGSGNVYESNCFDSEFAGFIWWGASAYDTYDAWLAASSQTDNNIEADPLFTNEGSADFTLAAGSPCIGTGESLGSPYNDALMPSSTWPDGVVTGDQDDY